ncbi:MAG TPA: PA14 domain-containing protein, partial [Planctomycetaceae bacterium]|nr:PA14 domain-containing protein [Planctomycetaceae bacterium]
MSRCLLLALCFAGGLIWADDAEEDEDSLPGLIGQYRIGKQQIERIDAAPAFVWGKDSPDPRLPDGPFHVTWKGRLLIREAGRYRFSAFGTGNVKITLNGKVVLGAGRSQLGWMDGEEIPLEFGEQSLEIDFQKAYFDTELRIFWSSDKFPLEPLPMEQLFRDGVRADLKSRERGRELFDAHRCARCHRAGEQPGVAAPA